MNIDDLRRAIIDADDMKTREDLVIRVPGIGRTLAPVILRFMGYEVEVPEKFKNWEKRRGFK